MAIASLFRIYSLETMYMQSRKSYCDCCTMYSILLANVLNQQSDPPHKGIYTYVHCAQLGRTCQTFFQREQVLKALSCRVSRFLNCNI